VNVISFCHLEIEACPADTPFDFYAGARLDGARGKKQVWRPYVRTWGISEANLLYRRKYLWHCWDFSAPLTVIRHL